MTTAQASPNQNGVGYGGANSFLLSARGGPGAGTRCLVDLQVRFCCVCSHSNYPPGSLSFLLCCSAANLPPDCINLSQGTQTLLLTWIKEVGEEALQSMAANHYSRPKGRLRLCQALKKHYDVYFCQGARASMSRQKSSSAVMPMKVSCAHVNDLIKSN